MCAHRRCCKFGIAHADRLDDPAVFVEGRVRTPIVGEDEAPNSVELRARGVEKALHARMGNMAKQQFVKRLVQFEKTPKIAARQCRRLRYDLPIYQDR